MKTKVIFIFSIIMFNFSYSQIIKYEYNVSKEYELDEKLDSYKFKQETYEESRTTVTIDEEEKTIIVSRQFIPSNGNGQATRIYEEYYYVKRDYDVELDGLNNVYRYAAIDLLNKKYMEIIVNDISMGISEDCSAFYPCKKFTIFLK